jgi:hypothetical protein
MDVEGRFINHGWIGVGDMNGEDWKEVNPPI